MKPQIDQKFPCKKTPVYVFCLLILSRSTRNGIGVFWSRCVFGYVSESVSELSSRFGHGRRHGPTLR